MNCGYSKEILALYVEGDLPRPDSVTKVERHVASCNECRQYCEELRRTQSLIKSRFQWSRQTPVSQNMLEGVRRGVMSQVETVGESMGWMLKLERFLMLSFRRPQYAAAGVAFVALLSISVLGQMRQPTSAANQALMCPTDYRQWIFVGSSQDCHKVYMNPASYEEYQHTGKFPEGTTMVREILSADQKDLVALQVSVKDSSRFAQGWGFYDFTESAGKLKKEAAPLPQTADCITCHREKGASDHVFTQFYPSL